MGKYLGGGGSSSANRTTECAKRPRSSLQKATPGAPKNGYIRPSMQNTFKPAPLNPHGVANIHGLR